MGWISTSNLTLNNFIVGVFLFAANRAWAVPISIQSRSDLDFGAAVQGDGPKTILPNSIETAENASFAVTGDAERFFSIILPDQAELQGNRGGGLIRIRNFVSSPSATATLNRAGEVMLYVGATRDSIPPYLPAAQYAGKFQITVSY